MSKNFKDWYKDCDILVSNILGISIDCLPDASWRDMYDDDMLPADAIDTAYEDHWFDDVPSDLWYGK